MSLFRLFLIFMKIGAILLGGGYVILPIIQSEFSDKRKIIQNEELINYYTLSQSLPGIVAANMSMFIGYRLKGIRGAVSAMLGIIFIPFWVIIFLASILNAFVNNLYIQGALWGIGIAVIALIILTVREMWQKTSHNLYFYALFLLSLSALLIFNLSPITVIVIFSITGIIFKVLQRSFSR